MSVERLHNTNILYLYGFLASQTDDLVGLLLWLLQITRDGKIVDESIVQMNARRKEHTQQAKEVVAATIVSKAVEIEVRKQPTLHV